jgi:hypothetical protein
MKLFICLSTFILLLTQTTLSQNFRNSIINENSNYFDIIDDYKKSIDSLKTLTDKKSKKKVKQFERWAAYWKDRVLPNGDFVAADHDYKEWVKNKSHQSSLSSRGSSRATNWSLVGPSSPPTSSVAFYPGMGRINALAFNGTDTNIMYVGSPAGGIWKTTNGGSNWVAKGDSFPNMGISDIVINPTNTNILYVATGDADGGQNRSIGILKSINGGNSWTTTGLTFTLGNIMSFLNY